MKKFLCAAAMAALMCSQSWAAFDLQVTEIWPGNEPGSNLTEDWFEVTNFGNTAWTSADGTLYFDDESADVADAEALTGITSIGPGESVIFVDEDESAAWLTLWTPAITAVPMPIPQVGDYDGSGLGGGGDSVSLFFDAGDDGLTFSDLIDFATYPDADSNGGQSYDTYVGAFTVPAFPAAVTTGNDEGQPAIGTPGWVVPEPTTVLLACFGFAFAGLRRRK